jgi:hypothetical protein
MARANRYHLWLLSLAASLPAAAVEVTDHLDFGGALRTRVDIDPGRDIHKFGIDTFMLRGSYDDGRWSAGARYRLQGKAYPYQYTYFGGLRFMEYAWVGYRQDDDNRWQFGLNQVPFGLQPLFSSSFLETLGNPIGLEDLYMVGAKYVHAQDGWDLSLGYYARPAWPGMGTGNGTTYSVVVTPADPGVAGGSRNEERNTVVARLARAIELGDWKGEAGLSAYHGQLRNRDTHRSGPRNAYAVHVQAQNGPWSVKLQFARQQMKPRNPDGSETVTVGAYDGTFNLAARGNLYAANLAYEVPDSFTGGTLTSLTPYISYSRFDKSARGFRATQRLLTGASFALHSLIVAVEWQTGRNDPYLGGSNYAQSLARGGSNRWSSQFYMNLGYYF